MTSQINLEDIYTELNDLLKDVCSFLSSEVQNGTLTSKAKNEAEKLVSRSRKQVEIISTISVLQENTNINYPYLQMQGPTLIEEHISEYVDTDVNYYETDDYEESYAQVNNETPSLNSPPSPSPSPPPPPPTITINEDYCPYSEMSACSMEEKAVKYGPLIRRERYFFLEQKKHYLVGLVGYWLLIYAINKKDQKPIQIINLTDFTAQSVEQKKDPAFEIYADNRRHEFIARTVKDMHQWIVAINCKKQININARNLPEIPSVSIEETIDQISVYSEKNFSQMNNDTQNTDDYESEGEIYESVDNLKKQDTLEASKHVEKSPKLPSRHQKHFSLFRWKQTQPNINVETTYNNITKFENNENILIEDNYEDDNTYDSVQFLNQPKIKETINKELIKTFVTLQTNDNDDNDDNYDSVDNGNLDEFDELPDYDELKTIPNPNNNNNDKQKSFGNHKMKEELSDYDELKQIVVNNNSKEGNKEELVEYDESKTIYNDRSTMKHLKNKSCSKENNSTNTLEEDDEDDELPDYDKLKPMPQNSEQIEADKKSVSKPVIVSPKPKLQIHLTKLPSTSKQRNIIQSKETGVKKVHSLVQQMEQTITFKPNKN